jgi:hypothetical protein
MYVKILLASIKTLTNIKDWSGSRVITSEFKNSSIFKDNTGVSVSVVMVKITVSEPLKRVTTVFLELGSSFIEASNKFKIKYNYSKPVNNFENHQLTCIFCPSKKYPLVTQSL